MRKEKDRLFKSYTTIENKVIGLSKQEIKKSKTKRSKITNILYTIYYAITNGIVNLFILELVLTLTNLSMIYLKIGPVTSLNNKVFITYTLALFIVLVIKLVLGYVLKPDELFFYDYANIYNNKNNIKSKIIKGRYYGLVVNKKNRFGENFVVVEIINKIDRTKKYTIMTNSSDISIGDRVMIKNIYIKIDKFPKYLKESTMSFYNKEEKYKKINLIERV